MKKLLFLVVLLVYFAPLTAFATDAENSAEHAALRELKTKVEDAINSGDIKTLASFLAKDFVFIAADQTVITTEEDLIGYWQKRFSSPDSIVTAMKTSITASIPTKFTSPVSGYCYGTSKDIYTLLNGKNIAIDSIWSTQLEKEDGVWKVKVAHAGVNYIDNPVLEAKSMSMFKKLGVLFKFSSLPGEVQK
ncbi:MAG: nuclear transport factor 2 family protein [Desulfobulbaceae bacterium]|nr:nuclear transport factor 2 family protein [Desulfobulbaceae bacterium]